MRGRTVQRREAILLLRDMSHFAEAMLVNFVFLRHLGEAADPELEHYELYVKAELGKSSRKFIERIVKKHQLRMRDGLDGFLGDLWT